MKREPGRLRPGSPACLSPRQAYLQRTSPSCEPPNSLQFRSVFSVPLASRLPLWVSVNLGLFLSGSSPVLQAGAPGSHGGGTASAPLATGPATIVSANISAVSSNAMRLRIGIPLFHPPCLQIHPSLVSIRVVRCSSPPFPLTPAANENRLPPP